MNLMEKIKSLDSADMYSHLREFPEQIIHSIEIAKNSPYFRNGTKKFFILGMGGSAISGDLLQVYFRNSKFNDIEIVVNRNYLLMKIIEPETNVIASSYSGNTEETISAYNFAKKYTKNIIGIGTGGELLRQLKIDGFEFVVIPSGLQPREALAYSFFPLLLIIIKSIADEKEYNYVVSQLYELANFLKEKSSEYSNLINNKALDFAKILKGNVVISYATEETLFPVAFRFKAQLQENSKNLAFAGIIPEICHNEINSFIYPNDLISRIKIILLTDINDHPKNNLRIEAIKNLLNDTIDIDIIQSNQNDFLFRMFDLIYFFDWVSYYLALENNIDPTPIAVIKKLKNEIQK